LRSVEQGRTDRSKPDALELGHGREDRGRDAAVHLPARISAQLFGSKVESEALDRHPAANEPADPLDPVLGSVGVRRSTHACRR
jgi:hypothetical protein